MNLLTFIIYLTKLFQPTSSSEVKYYIWVIFIQIFFSFLILYGLTFIYYKCVLEVSILYKWQNIGIDKWWIHFYDTKIFLQII